MPSSTVLPASRDQTPESKTKRITNPLRLLILTPSNQSNETIPVLLQSLTGVPVTPPAASTSSTDLPSFAGYTTHAPFQISNKYYSADVPIWVDELPLSPSPSPPNPELSSTATATATAEEQLESSNNPQEWKTAFLSTEAREVRDAIGAIVLCIRNPSSTKIISPAVPKEALDHALSADDSTTEVLQAAIKKDGKDPADHKDVHSIKELVGIMSELKTKIEEERSGEGDDDDDMAMGMAGGAEVPCILLLVDEHRSFVSAVAAPKNGSSTGGDDGGGGGDEILETQEPFSVTWWEELLYELGIFGLEVIQWTPESLSPSASNTDIPESRNIYGELEGLPRLKEVLSTHEWTSSAGNYDDEDEDEDDILSFLNGGGTGARRDENESAGFRREVNQLEREMMGLRFAINGGDADDDSNEEVEQGEDTKLQVENLEALMMRMRAIKDMTADLPESKRQAFAAKAVKDIMREI